MLIIMRDSVRWPALVTWCIALTTLLGCSPLPMLQDARIVRKHQTRVGVAGQVAFPLAEGTYFTPDGPGAKGASDADLAYLPLTHLSGWIRHGVEDYLEVQGIVHIPTFTILLGIKMGLVGQSIDDPFGLALVLDGGASLAFLNPAYGASLVSTVALGHEVALDLSARFGALSGLWAAPSLTTMVGVSVGRKEVIRVGLGASWSVGPEESEAVPALVLVAGWETP